MAKVNVEVKTTVQQMQNRILNSFLVTFQRALNSAAPAIREKAAIILQKRILQQPEIQSLIGGDLQAEMGLVAPAQNVKEIIDTVIRSISLVKKPTIISGNKVSGGFSLNMIEEDFSDVLSLSTSSFISENGHLVSWLEWLLTRGDDIILRDYSITFDLSPSEVEKSRTGDALMIKSTRGWRVPPEFSGTLDNNFITRAADGISNELSAMMSREIQARIQ